MLSVSQATKLLESARSETDEDRRESLLSSVADAGPELVRPLVERLLGASSDVERLLGADLICAMPSLTESDRASLRDQGFPIVGAAPFSEADRAALAPLVSTALDKAESVDLLLSLLPAAGKLARPELLDAVLRRVGHADDEVRESCAQVLPWLDPDGPSERAVTALVALARDPVASVRDWALFGLGRGQIDPVDTPQTRAVFQENVSHPDEDVRAEAIEALGLLGDVEMLATALHREDIGHEALELAARLEDPGSTVRWCASKSKAGHTPRIRYSVGTAKH